MNGWRKGIRRNQGNQEAAEKGNEEEAASNQVSFCG